jgi:hypothetical protein
LQTIEQVVAVKKNHPKHKCAKQDPIAVADEVLNHGANLDDFHQIPHTVLLGVAYFGLILSHASQGPRSHPIGGFISTMQTQTAEAYFPH